MSNFMQRQITGLQNWLRVETTHGTEFVRIADTSLFVRDSETVTHPMSDEERETHRKDSHSTPKAEPQSWENIKGYGARLSAPGYLDCTEWTVFDTEDEARELPRQRCIRRIRRRRTRERVQHPPASGAVRVNLARGLKPQREKDAMKNMKRISKVTIKRMTDMTRTRPIWASTPTGRRRITRLTADTRLIARSTLAQMANCSGTRRAVGESNCR